jgi:hypothetical protein
VTGEGAQDETSAGPPKGGGALAKIVELEAGVWRSLIQWIRHKRDLGDHDTGVAYAKAAVPAIWVFVALSAVEIPILDLLIPSTTWRIIFLVLGAWGLIWMLGFVASMHVKPHVVGPAGLRLRQGLLIDIPVDWDLVEMVQLRRQTLAGSRALQTEDTPDGPAVMLAVSSMVNVEILLNEPLSIKVPKVGMVQASVLRCYADEPSEFVEAVTPFVLGTYEPR